MAATETKRPVRRPAKKAPKAAIRKHAEREEPEALRVRVLTTAFTVNDVEASLKWYRDVVGFTHEGDIMRNGVRTGVRLKAGTMVLRLGQDDWAKGRDRAKGVGSRCYLSTDQDVDKLAGRIKANGGTLDSEPEDFPAYAVRAFSITDPDGFKFTISRPLS